MATTSNPSGSTAAKTTTRRRSTGTTRRGTTAAASRNTKANAKSTASSARQTARSARSTGRAAGTTARRGARGAAHTTGNRVEQVQTLAERALLVQVGAGLVVRDNLVSTVTGLRNKYSTRASVERELKRYERRGNTARNRFERQVRRARTQIERELRQRRNQAQDLGARAQKLVGDALN